MHQEMQHQHKKYLLDDFPSLAQGTAVQGIKKHNGFAIKFIRFLYIQFTKNQSQPTPGLGCRTFVVEGWTSMR